MHILEMLFGELKLCLLKKILLSLSKVCSICRVNSSEYSPEVRK